MRKDVSLFYHQKIVLMTKFSSIISLKVLSLHTFFLFYDVSSKISLLLDAVVINDWFGFGIILTQKKNKEQNKRNKYIQIFLII